MTEPDWKITTLSYRHRGTRLTTSSDVVDGVKAVDDVDTRDVVPAAQWRLVIPRQTGGQDSPFKLVRRLKSRLSRSTPDLSTKPSPTDALITMDSIGDSRSTQPGFTGLPATLFGAAAKARSTCYLPTEPVRADPGCDAFTQVASTKTVKLIGEGMAQVSVVTQARSVVDKILASKYLRKWETHNLVLTDHSLASRKPAGFLEKPIPYTQMTDIHAVSSWESFCIRIAIPRGYLIIQVSSRAQRDQWYFSVLWRKNLLFFRQTLKPPIRYEVLSKETKNVLDFIAKFPVQDTTTYQAPLHIISSLLIEDQKSFSQEEVEDLFLIMAPLMEQQFPPEVTFSAIRRHFERYPNSLLIRGIFAIVVQRILKHCADFGSVPYMRQFVLDYFLVLLGQHRGPESLADFLGNLHGTASLCPHPRILPNLVAVSLSGIASYFSSRKSETHTNPQENCDIPIIKITLVEGPDEETPEALPSGEKENYVHCSLLILQTIAKRDDWRGKLAQLIQSVPFPDESLADRAFSRELSAVINSIGTDPRCEVHQCVLRIRENRPGWFPILCPSSPTCPDDGTIWASILETLMNCCGRRKKFISSLTDSWDVLQLLALRGHSGAQQALCLMLQYNSKDNFDSAMDKDDGRTAACLISSSLQSTALGSKLYYDLCQKQLHVRKPHQKVEPVKLSLPPNSTDQNVAFLLSTGALSSVETLDLAFTKVTSACANSLIQLPLLRNLNLWSTQFGDSGLQLISDHLHQLEALNLCETPVTDQGLLCLSSLKNLRKLNLNSTKLSPSVLEHLKEALPYLEEIDVTYTDAW